MDHGFFELEAVDHGFFESEAVAARPVLRGREEVRAGDVVDLLLLRVRFEVGEETYSNKMLLKRDLKRG